MFLSSSFLFGFWLMLCWICKDFFDFVLVTVVKAVATPDSAVELPLTAKNVENVMDEVRPYLIADGGNVALHEIDGNIVRLKLQGVGSRVSKCVYLLFLPLLVFVEYVKDWEVESGCTSSIFYVEKFQLLELDLDNWSSLWYCVQSNN